MRAAQKALPVVLCRAFQRGSHAVIPTIEVAKKCNHAENFHNFSIVPILVQAFGNDGVYAVGYAGCSHGKIERCAFGIRKSRVAAVFPDVLQFVRCRAVSFGRPDGMGLAILATCVQRSHITDESFQIARHATLVVHHSLVEPDKGFGNSGAALHGEYGIGAKSEGFVKKSSEFGDFGVVIGWERGDEAHRWKSERSERE